MLIPSSLPGSLKELEDHLSILEILLAKGRKVGERIEEVRAEIERRESKLTVDEAITLAEKRNRQWCLIWTDPDGEKMYGCSRCGYVCYSCRLRSGAIAHPPAHCPKCGEEQGLED